MARGLQGFIERDHRPARPVRPSRSKVADEDLVPPISPDDLVMRSVNLIRSQDDELRQMAHDRRVSKNDLIRAAIASKLDEWARVDEDAFETDLQKGRIGISD